MSVSKYATTDDIRQRFRSVFQAAGARQTTCKLCNRTIWWLPAHRSPFSDDGVSHFADCPNAEQFRGAR